jgi:hypothetical protein
VLDQANPVKQLQGQLQMIQQFDSTIAEGYNLAKELFTKDNTLESLQRASEVQPNTRDPFERLQQTTGMGPGTTNSDSLERLSQTVGTEGKDSLADLTQTLDNSPTHLPEIAPALEPPVEEHAIEATIELLL